MKNAISFTGIPDRRSSGSGEIIISEKFVIFFKKSYNTISSAQSVRRNFSLYECRLLEKSKFLMGRHGNFSLKMKANYLSYLAKEPKQNDAMRQCIA